MLPSASGPMAAMRSATSLSASRALMSRWLRSTAAAGVPAGAIQEALNAADDMKAITGIYDASLGARSNETSGRAILARQREGDVGTFHFLDNLSRAIQYAGRVLVQIIPSLYSAQQTVRILGDDQKAKVVKLTQEAGGGGQAAFPPEHHQKAQIVPVHCCPLDARKRNARVADSLHFCRNAGYLCQFTQVCPRLSLSALPFH